MAATEQEARVQVAWGCRRLCERGLNHPLSGNVSARVDARVVVKPTAIDYDALTPEDLAVVSLSGDLLAGPLPSSELPLHLAIYRVRPDVAAVAHAHPVHAQALAMLRRPLPPVLDETVALFGGPVPVAPYAVSGSRALAEGAAAMLGTGAAVLLANHGAVTVGRSVREAVVRMEVLERACAAYLAAVRAGEVKELPGEAVAAERALYERSLTRQDDM